MGKTRSAHMLQFASAVRIQNVDQLVMIVEDVHMQGDKHTSSYCIGVLNMHNTFKSLDIAETEAMKIAEMVQAISTGEDNATS